MRRCYALNFGWPQELSISQLTVNLDNDRIFNAEMVRQSAPSNCFMVFIGGKYLKRIEEIVGKVEIVTDGLATKPTVYFADKEMENLMVNLRHIFLVRQLNLFFNSKTYY